MENHTNTNTTHRIERDDFTLADEFDCEHPKCDTLHKKWHDERGLCRKPRASRAEWVIIDTATDCRAEHYLLSETFKTKREAQAALDFYLRMMARKQEVK